MSVSKKSFTKENKILLVGGTGYLGSQLKLSLSQEGFKQVFISSSKEKGKGIIQLDLLNKSHVSAIRDMDFDFIINLTGQVSNPIDSCLKLNSLGMENLIQICTGKSKLIHLSTVNLYGTGEGFDETTVPQPETPYSTLKLVSEKFLMEKGDKTGFSIIRLSNLYGGKQPKGIFAYLFRSALNRELSLHFNNDGYMVRNYLHVEDAAMGIINLAQKTNFENKEIYNFVGRDELSIRELIGKFENIFNLNFQVRFSNQKAWENSLDISDQKFRTLTGFKEKFLLEDYIKKLKADAHQ
ncbi:NAD-dependent epimerase/dehydratase family protein [Algoriphagus hitonicola]|uniref:Nucleoside-diphosphate-sugar epimerase n=1 Tax=Algoriphagus hitonicola TaxID=435880 RepID=A0A1I2X4W9_9BACT|nr:NAD(P)-dependent oxidoreductase [Algoriphagus hitonicola]SFH07979.1 Nucleoside-diphosphate-sugar epimerase [Algoriphagus hitonicola]